MADILNCDWGSDAVGANAADGCEKQGGVVAIWFGHKNDINLVSSSATAKWDNTLEVIKAAPVMNTGKKLKKLVFDADTAEITDTGGADKKWKNELVFDSNGLTPAKSKNYRRMLGCCGVVYYARLTDGTMLVGGLQPDSSGKLVAIPKPLTFTEIKYQSGKRGDDNSKQVISLKLEGESDYGLLHATSALTDAALDALL